MTLLRLKFSDETYFMLSFFNKKTTKVNDSSSSNSTSTTSATSTSVNNCVSTAKIASSPSSANENPSELLLSRKEFEELKSYLESVSYVIEKKTGKIITFQSKVQEVKVELVSFNLTDFVVGLPVVSLGEKLPQCTHYLRTNEKLIGKFLALIFPSCSVSSDKKKKMVDIMDLNKYDLDKIFAPEKPEVNDPMRYNYTLGF